MANDHIQLLLGSRKYFKKNGIIMTSCKAPENIKLCKWVTGLGRWWFSKHLQYLTNCFLLVRHLENLNIMTKMTRRLPWHCKVFNLFFGCLSACNSMKCSLVIWWKCILSKVLMVSGTRQFWQPYRVSC